jgi:hypothetical protein
MELFDNYSKAEYILLLNETIEIFRLQCNNEEDILSQNILEQLLDIRENVIELGVLTEWDDINERYTLGGLAIKNFEEDDELGKRIQNVFWGALNYHNLN